MAETVPVSRVKLPEIMVALADHGRSPVTAGWCPLIAGRGGCPYVFVKRRVDGRLGRGFRRGAWRRGRRSAPLSPEVLLFYKTETVTNVMAGYT